MPKNINIQSLLQANDSLKKDSLFGFMEYYGIEIKDAEIEDLRSLVNVLCSCEAFIYTFGTPPHGRRAKATKILKNI
jgi:hypothetical protein